MRQPNNVSFCFNGSMTSDCTLTLIASFLATATLWRCSTRALSAALRMTLRTMLTLVDIKHMYCACDHCVGQATCHKL